MTLRELRAWAEAASLAGEPEIAAAFWTLAALQQEPRRVRLVRRGARRGS